MLYFSHKTVYIFFTVTQCLAEGGGRMKWWTKLLLSAVLTVMVSFTAIGYARLSDPLRIDGEAGAKYKPFKGVYIKSVEVVDTVGATEVAGGYVLPTNHTVTVDAAQTNGSVTYKMTVHNNSDVTYWYIGTRYTADYGSNALLDTENGIRIVTKDQLSDSYGSFNEEDWIPPQTERVFYVTYLYGEAAQSPCETMVNFHFDIHMDAVHDEFLAVLNNMLSPTSYNELKNVFEREYTENHFKTITTETHPEVFEKMFADLMVNIDGEEKKASIVIRRENLDKDVSSGDDYLNDAHVGCEYALYITVEPLTPGTTPTVYAIAYSQGAAGMGSQWYQVGELYEGTAPILADGSIDYKNWVATEKTYEIADGIVYKVAAPNGDQYDIMKTLEQLISAEDQDVFNDIDNTHIFKKTYDILQKHPGSTDPAVLGLQKAFEEASIFYNNLNNGQEFKVVRGVYTRAEIIHALKKIQTAMDYYNQAYPE